jgi:hypothetical protein
VNDKPSTSNGHNKIQQQEVSSMSHQPAVRRPSSPPPSSIPQQERPPMSYQSIREPSPPPITQPERSSSPPAQEFNSSIYQNIGNQFETQRSATNEATNQFVGSVNVSSLLRQRKTSSSSSKNDDDEWADDRQSYNQQSERRSPSPVQSSNNNNNQNEGIKCMARYSYQKTEEDELGFEEHEIITNVKKMHDEWWFGKIGSRSGLFPANYVEEI